MNDSVESLRGEVTSGCSYVFTSIEIHILPIYIYTNHKSIRRVPGSDVQCNLAIFQNFEWSLPKKSQNLHSFPDAWVIPLHGFPVINHASATIELELVPGLRKYQATRYRVKTPLGPTKFRVSYPEKKHV